MHCLAMCALQLCKWILCICTHHVHYCVYQDRVLTWAHVHMCLLHWVDTWAKNILPNKLHVSSWSCGHPLRAMVAHNPVCIPCSCDNGTGACVSEHASRCGPCRCNPNITGCLSSLHSWVCKLCLCIWVSERLANECETDIFPGLWLGVFALFISSLDLVAFLLCQRI